MSQIENPFKNLIVVRRDALASTFTSGTDVGFLCKAQLEGLQAAFSDTKGRDRARRIRKLSHIQPSWWKPNEQWEGFCEMLRPDMVSDLPDEDA